MKFVAMTRSAERAEPEIRLIIANMNAHLRANGREAVAVSGLVLSEMATAGASLGDLPRRMTVARLRVTYEMRPEVWELVITLTQTNFLMEEVMVTGMWSAVFNGRIYCDAIETMKTADAPSDAKIISEIMLAMSNVVVEHGRNLDAGTARREDEQMPGKPASSGVLGHTH